MATQKTNNPSTTTQQTTSSTPQNPWDFVIGQDLQGNAITLEDLKEISQKLPGLELTLSSKGDQSVLLPDPYVTQYNEYLLKTVYPAFEENYKAAMQSVDEANKGIEEYNQWIMGQSPNSTPHQRLGAGLTPWGTSPYGGSLLRGQPLAPPPFQPPPPLEKLPRGTEERSSSVKFGTPEPSTSKNGSTKKREPLRITDVKGNLVTYGIQKRADQTLKDAAQWWEHFQVLQQNIATIFDFDKNNIGGSWQNNAPDNIQIQFKDQNGQTKSFDVNPKKTQFLGANMLYYLATYMKNDPAFASEVSSALGQKVDTSAHAAQIAQAMAKLIKKKIDKVKSKPNNANFADDLENTLGSLFSVWTKKLEVLARNVPYLQKRASQIFSKYETDFNNDKEILDDMGALLTFYTLREAPDIANQDAIFQQLAK